MYSSMGPDNKDPLLYKIPEFSQKISKQVAPSLSPSEKQAVSTYVVIDGYKLPCIAVAGEPRIPLNFVFELLMKHLDQEVITQLMEDLSVHDHVANQNQLLQLRNLDPELNVNTIRLVSRTDVERMLAAKRTESRVHRMDAIKVDLSERLAICHYMFGKARGWFYPSRQGGRSIQCYECSAWFIPEDFVMHTHSENKENQRVVHWGFDSANWRLMLCVDDEEYQSQAELQEVMKTWAKIVEPEEVEREIKYAAFKRGVEEIGEVEAVPAKIVPSPDAICLSSPKSAANLFVSPFLKKDPENPLLEIIRKEMRFKERVMSDANNGRLPGFDPSKPTTSANQILERQPQIRSPSHFPVVELEATGSNYRTTLNTIAEIEANLTPDNERLRALCEQLRVSATRDNAEMRQQAVNYQNMLESYKLLVYLWRLINYPNTPYETNNLQQIRAEQSSLPEVSRAMFHNNANSSSQQPNGLDPTLTQQLIARMLQPANVQSPSDQLALQRTHFELLARGDLGRQLAPQQNLAPQQLAPQQLPVNSQLSAQQWATIAQLLTPRPPQSS